MTSLKNVLQITVLSLCTVLKSSKLDKYFEDSDKYDSVFLNCLPFLLLYFNIATRKENC